MSFPKFKVSRLLVMTPLMAGMILGATYGQTSDHVDHFKTRLWSVEDPVDILVWNPGGGPLELPEPYMPPSLKELYGPGFDESALPNQIHVGSNITFAVAYADDPNEGFWDPALGAARRAAFEAGALIWAERLQGPASVSIIATMSPRGGDAHNAVLASSGPGQYWMNFWHAPMTNTYYPEALVEIISGSDPDANTTEIAVDFNSDVDNPVVLGPINWYYGLDANPGIHVDFVTVTAHELCHGLGFISWFGADGSWGDPDPVIYDRFLVNGADDQLIAQPVDPNNVIGGDVFWNGLRGAYAYNTDFGGSGNVPMFAPTPFEGGSSISHLDEATFTGVWELQTPYYDGPLHTPDPILLGMLQDIGHSLEQSRYVDLDASGFEDGSSANPFDTLAEGRNNVPLGGHVRILPGTYSDTFVENRPMVLHSSGGIVVIGQ